MPVPMRTTYLKAEAKYNVTTEFPSLGLHSAAATGNIGLVEYALDHGQPINSVLDGVLPLHAACAGGNVQVVKMLIDHGADVNAPRLPRRYSNEKNRDTSAPIVGTSGSTPLHFAAANGNRDVITLLLLHGAHADLADKHGVSPEMLARQHGWLECADVLKEWVFNKDRDLRERPGGRADDPRAVANGHYSRERLEFFGIDGETSSSTRRRLHMKHSIDTALNILKSSSTGISESYFKPPPPLSSVNNLASTPPASPRKEFGEYAHLQVPPSDDERNIIDGESRQLSLPYALRPPPAGRSRHRRASDQVSSSTSPQRPRSAGSGAETQDEEPHLAFSRGGAGKKLGSKYSLMNIFKKAQSSDGGSFIHPATEGPPSISNPAPPSGSVSATDVPLSSFPNSVTPYSNFSPSRQNENENANSSVNTSFTTTSGSPFSRSGLRFHRGSDASTRSHATSQQSPSSQPLHRKSSINSPQRVPLPLAVDLHNALAQQQQDRQQPRRSRDRSRSTGSGPKYSEDNSAVSPSPSSSPLARLGILRSQRHNRDRSDSGASLGTSSSHRGGAVFDDDLVVTIVDAGETANGKTGTRPSILRGHNRTPLVGQVPGALPSGFRALRFDSTSSGSSREKAMDVAEQDAVSHVAALGLRSCSSAGSLSKFGRRPRVGKRPGSVGSGVGDSRTTIPKSVSAVVSDSGLTAGNDITEERIVVDEEEFDYGRPIVPPDFGALDSKSHAAVLLRERGLSFTSSSQSSLSPTLANDGDDGAAAVEGTTLMKAEFPFSINRPPPLHLGGSDSSGPTQDILHAPLPGSNRSRGGSMSSASTSDSRNNLQLKLNIEDPVSGGGVNDTAEFQHDLYILAQSSPEKDDQLEIRCPASEKVQDVGVDNGRLAIHGLNERRAHTPLDINITSISSHAQAEALVQRAQQDILEMARSNELMPTTSNTGRSPLSARLAAYGESLALERKLREQKEVGSKPSGDKLVLSQPASKSDNRMRESIGIPRTTVLARRDGIDRQHSLENRSGTPRVRYKGKDPQRPSTAEGLSSRHANTSLSNDQMSHSHHPKRSASGFSSNLLSTELQAAPPVDDDSHQPHSVPATIPKIQRDPDSSLGYSRPITRSRTPMVEAEQDQLSSLDCLDTELGPAVFRVSTAPLALPSPTRGKREQVKSASKLRRMGFSPAEQAGHVPPPIGSKRFGGIKSLMQTFKGKP